MKYWQVPGIDGLVLVGVDDVTDGVLRYVGALLTKPKPQTS